MISHAARVRKIPRRRDTPFSTTALVFFISDNPSPNHRHELTSSTQRSNPKPPPANATARTSKPRAPAASPRRRSRTVQTLTQKPNRTRTGSSRDLQNYARYTAEQATPARNARTRRHPHEHEWCSKIPAARKDPRPPLSNHERTARARTSHVTWNASP